ncbi:homocysteine S-methyltransferase family protein [Anaeromyxobacter oryzae]|uniref:homocysteine S-methyltransferase family protein n=1 Tax=Anaeromyxobacter oryzae TaxID=2918170 RepID=UPI0020C1144B|nr:homocysteine S-methyltransferase family protein [Anaeromyxobacter oryzae]
MQLDGPLLLDGAMGTALLDRGLPAGAPPEAWLAERPAEIARVHRAHAAAGARVLLTSTFNVAAPRLEAALPGADVAALCRTAVALARDAAPGVLVAGDLGPTGLVVPGRPPADPAGLRARYAGAAGALAAAGADLIWIESQWDLGEARLALAAARDTGLPVVVTFTLRERLGDLEAPDGTAAEALLADVALDGALAVGVNCVSPGKALARLADWAARKLPAPLVAKPSPGLPGALLAPAAFADAVRPAVAAGLRVVGGCCGATGEHLRALAGVLPPA